MVMVLIMVMVMVMVMVLRRHRIGTHGAVCIVDVRAKVDREVAEGAVEDAT